MEPYPEFDVEDLADFTGRPSVSFPGYIDEALSQAVFLIKLRTGLKFFPKDPELQQLVKYAILDLADVMHLEREYARIKANPLSSETIGSYSWSKSNAVMNSRYKSHPTGIEWLDVLLEYLADKENESSGMMTHGSVHVFEDDGVYYGTDGERHAFGPDDLIDRRRFGRGFPV